MMPYLFPTDPFFLEKSRQLVLGHFQFEKIIDIAAIFVEVGIGNIENHPQNFLHVNDSGGKGSSTSLNAGIHIVGLRLCLAPPSTSPNSRYFDLALLKVRADMPQGFAAASSVNPRMFSLRASCFFWRGTFSYILRSGALEETSAV
jgi:hypothetical protein